MCLKYLNRMQVCKQAGLAQGVTHSVSLFIFSLLSFVAGGFTETCLVVLLCSTFLSLTATLGRNLTVLGVSINSKVDVFLSSVFELSDVVIELRLLRI